MIPAVSACGGRRHFAEFAEDTARGDGAGNDDGDTEQVRVVTNPTHVIYAKGVHAVAKEA